MTNWNDIFDLYVGKNDYMKGWMKRPFINFDGYQDLKKLKEE